MRGGRTSSSPTAPGSTSVPAPSTTLDVDAGVRPPGRAELLGVLPGVGRGPTDDLTDLGLPVAVQHDGAEALHEAARGGR